LFLILCFDLDQLLQINIYVYFIPINPTDSDLFAQLMPCS
jgi:hypothetical protein